MPSLKITTDSKPLNFFFNHTKCIQFHWMKDKEASNPQAPPNTFKITASLNIIYVACSQYIITRFCVNKSCKNDIMHKWGQGPFSWSISFWLHEHKFSQYSTSKKFWIFYIYAHYFLIYMYRPYMHNLE